MNGNQKRLGVEKKRKKKEKKNKKKKERERIKQGGVV